MLFKKGFVSPGSTVSAVHSGLNVPKPNFSFSNAKKKALQNPTAATYAGDYSNVRTTDVIGSLIPVVNGLPSKWKNKINQPATNLSKNNPHIFEPLLQAANIGSWFVPLPGARASKGSKAGKVAIKSSKGTRAPLKMPKWKPRPPPRPTTTTPNVPPVVTVSTPGTTAPTQGINNPATPGAASPSIWDRIGQVSNVMGIAGAGAGLLTGVTGAENLRDAVDGEGRFMEGISRLRGGGPRTPVTPGQEGGDDEPETPGSDPSDVTWQPSDESDDTGGAYAPGFNLPGGTPVIIQHGVGTGAVDAPYLSSLPNAYSNVMSSGITMGTMLDLEIFKKIMEIKSRPTRKGKKTYTRRKKDFVFDEYGRRIYLPGIRVLNRRR